MGTTYFCQGLFYSLYWSWLTIKPSSRALCDQQRPLPHGHEFQIDQQAMPQKCGQTCRWMKACEQSDRQHKHTYFRHLFSQRWCWRRRWQLPVALPSYCNGREYGNSWKRMVPRACQTLQCVLRSKVGHNGVGTSRVGWQRRSSVHICVCMWGRVFNMLSSV